MREFGGDGGEVDTEDWTIGEEEGTEFLFRYLVKREGIILYQQPAEG